MSVTSESHIRQHAGVKVVLDTSVIRHFVEGDDQGRSFHRLREFSNRATFHLSDTSLWELVNWLSNSDSSTWTRWATASKILEEILANDAPIVSVSGIKPQNLHQVHAKAVIKLLLISESLEDLQKGVVVDSSSQIMLNLEDARKSVHADFKKWCDYMDKVSDHVQSKRLTPEVVQKSILASLYRDDFTGAESQLHRRLEPFVRAISRFAQIRTQPKTPYNPSSSGRRTDHLDLRLLKSLVDADYVCSNDERLLSHLALSGTEEIERVVDLIGMIETLEAGRESSWKNQEIL